MSLALHYYRRSGVALAMRHRQ